MAEQIVVIGAGLGGLAAALRLAHAGHFVVVCEAHDAPGGKMRALPSAAGPVDAGPTVMTMRSVFEGLFAEVGERLEDHVTLHQETTLARHFWHDGSTLDLFADPEQSAAAVRAFSGGKSERQFRAFSAQAKSLFEAFDVPMMQSASPNLAALTAAALKRPALAKLLMSGRTLATELVRQFDDQRLRQLFGRYATYVGGSPYESSALLSLIWHAEASGVWRVDGGMHALARAIAGLAETRGVEFRYNSPVSEIETQSGRVSGVRLVSGERIATRQVLFNGDPRAIATGKLGADVTRAVPRKAVEPRSLSAEVWAFAAVPKGPDLIHHNVFFGGNPEDEFRPIARGERPRDPTLYVCAQDRGAGLEPVQGSASIQLERFEIIMNAAPDTSQADLPLTEETRPCRKTVFETLKAHGLRFTPDPADATATGPAQFNRLFPASQGSLYGRSPHGLTASLDKPRVVTKVPGLFLAGGGVHPGAGIPMATLSGRHAAEAMLKDRASTSASTRTATPGGTSTGSRTMANTLSRSSLS